MISVDIDLTALIQLVNFIVTLLVLNWLVVKPVLKNMQKRQDAATSLGAEAGKLAASAKEKLTSYETSLQTAHADAAVKRDAVIEAAAQKEQTLVFSATKEAQEFIEEQRKNFKKELASIESDLRAQVAGFADKTVAKILG